MMLPSGSGTPSTAADGGGGTTPCAQQQHPGAFDYFVVLDFEATCEKNARIYPQEIIEFPSVLVDGATGSVLSEFRTYVRPQHHPVLTDFCREFTGIRQADVDAGVELAEALRLHGAWLEEHAVVRVQGGRFAVVTWGDWDCRTMLESECLFKRVAKPPYFDRWINLKIPFAAALGSGQQRRWAGLGTAIRMAGLEFEGRPHCGLDDTRNTARLLGELTRRGVQLGITGCCCCRPLPKRGKRSTRVTSGASADEQQ